MKQTYWYKHYLKSYANYPKQELEKNFAEYEQLRVEGLAYRHGVLYFYNGDKTFYEGILNAIATLLEKNQYYFFK